METTTEKKRDYKPGSLVSARGRDWVVMPTNDPELLRIRPLGGSEDETTGIYLPLNIQSDYVKLAHFHPPAAPDLGNFTSARLLYNACRLSFRSGAGPFRSLARLSFRPRPYQMVPLIMALRQAPDPVRLLVADDVGVGKTIEAILILKELLERREVERFAVICLPHLCEQWQRELRDKAGIEAVIIRSNTQARLDREVPSGVTSVYRYYPYQVISIDYIKADQRRAVFLHECPELVIVDEAHTATKPAGALKSQQQRYHLLHDLADVKRRPNQHLLLLTATPHSGKQEEFQSLLGLLNPRFENLDLPTATPAQRRELARHFVQRRRADVECWLGEDTPFPKRLPEEQPYDLAPEYRAVYNEVLTLAQQLTQKAGHLSAGQQKFHYWTALALLRGVMSSPAAGIEMLRNRQLNLSQDDELALEEVAEAEAAAPNPILDQDFGTEGDFLPTQIVSRATLTAAQNNRLRDLISKLEKLDSLKADQKAAQAVQLAREWLKAGYQPVIFCRYIATAKYLGALLTDALKRVGHSAVDVRVVTSEDPDEERRRRIEEMAAAPLRVLVATDCLSEGINLQHLFTAVLHYDLPWNPNRLEQREGRVDRYGQTAPTVRACLLYGRDNPMDSVVLGVLLRKVREIRTATGITVPFPEDSQTVMDAVLTAVLLNPKAAAAASGAVQLTLDLGEEATIRTYKDRVSNAYEAAAAREKESRSIFAQNAIRPDEIAEDLHQADDAIGNPAAVAMFVTQALPALLGTQIQPDRMPSSEAPGYTLFTANLPPVLQATLPPKAEVKVSFESPTPAGYLYLGRNHVFVEQLCQLLLANAVQQRKQAPARAAVLRTAAVTTKTTLVVFRVRNVIEEVKLNRQIVAEEMLIWGYRGSLASNDFLGADEARALLETATPAFPEPPDDFRQRRLAAERETLFDLDDPAEPIRLSLRPTLDDVALVRAQNLVQAHERFRQAVGGSRCQVVTPVLPMDVMGLYVLYPPLA